MTTSFLSREELSQVGFASFGDNVLISRHCSIYKPSAISLGSNVRVDDFCVLSGGKRIQIGNYIHIAAFCAIYGAGEIVMEDFSGISSRVTLYSISDDFSGNSMSNPMVPDKYKPRLKCAPVILKRHALIGSGCTVLPGVTLAEGATVGSHSLVTKSCREWSIYFGAPARRIGPRSAKVLELEKAFMAELAQSASQLQGGAT